MSECKFCNFEKESGDIPEDREELAHLENITIPINERRIKGEVYANMEVSISKDKGKIALYTVLWDEHGYDIFENQSPINYCPMCGRKLNEEE